ncbi:hypothetical protein [Reichenbachiella sp.]|uniref:hypothetical protein n=1 Tax=Reichenbachiella sp. TaxID=2184521 RepID=UPI003B5B090D
MNRRFHLPLLCILSIGCLFGCISEDSNSLDPSEIFIKYYGSESEEVAVDLLELSDGFLLLGSRTDVDNSDYYLVRTDTAGNRLWEGVINNDTIGTVDIPSKMYFDDVNQKLYIIGTSTFDRGDDNLEQIPVDHLFLVDLDLSATGFTIANSMVYRYFDSRSSSDPSYVPAFKETSGADILVSGDDLIVLGSVEAGSNDPSSEDNSILLMKITRDFTTTDWERVKGFDGDDFGRTLLEAGGRYFYMGAVNTANLGIGHGLVDVIVEEFDVVSGNEDHKWEYGTPDNDEGANMIYTDPGIVIVGTTGSGSTQYAFIVNTTRGLGDAEIKPLTYPRSSSENWNTEGADVAQTSSGDYFIVGNVKSFSDAAADPRENEILLIPTNGVGEVYEEAVQEYGSVQNDAGNAIIRRADGTLVIAATVHFGGSATMLSLLKTNRNGEFLKN